MNDDADPVVRDAEEPVGLDQLEPLVGERRGVDSDLPPHRPGRMVEGFGDRDVLELGARAATERPAGGGEHDLLDRLGRAPLEALEDRGMLAVDRKQQAAPAAVRGDRELAGGDEALLVRERKRDAALERPQGRLDAGEADDRVEDDVGIARVEERRCRAAHLDVLHPVGGGEVGEGPCSRHERAQLELGAPLHDLDGLAADRAGRTEESDALHGLRVPDTEALR